MIRTLRFSTFLFLLLISSHAFSQLTTTSGVSTNTLISNLVGPGATVTNVTLNCPGSAYGTFSSASTNLGLTSGVMLTTGTTNSAVGPNNSSSAGFDHGSSSSDPDLTALEPLATHDLCVLEFDIIPSCNQLSINYVFGSEEYPEFVCSTYNDVFGFFISGPNPGGGNYTSQNIALIPSTSIPVAINSVNPGTPGTSSGGGTCTSLAYSSYYVNNTSNSIQYDGFTTPLTAVASVVPCSTYHMKIAIADAGDGIYDSGVFFAYQGLNCPSAPLVTISAVSSTICPGQSVTLNASGATSYTWSPPTGLNTTSGPSVVASPTSTTTYTVTGTSGCSITTDTIIVIVNPPVINAGPDVTICENGSTTLTATGASTYQWSPAAGLSATNISNPVASPLTTTTYTVTGTTASSCIGTDIVIVNVNNTIVNAGADVSICSGGSTTLNASGATTYNWSPTASLSNPGISNPVASPATTTTYTVTGTANGCTDTDDVIVTVGAMVVTASADTSICNGASAQLSASGGTTFTWSPSGSLNNSNIQNPIASPSTTTTYTVTGSSGSCSATDVVIVNVGSISVNAGADVTICAGTSTNLAAVGGTTFTWNPATSLNNASISNPVASPASTTTYTVTGTNGSCTGTDDVIVNVTPIPVVVTSPNATVCAGTSVPLTAGGATTYTWNPSATLDNSTISNPVASPSTTTTYTVTGTTSGCSSTATVSVTVNPIPVITASNDTTICTGTSAQLNASGASSYSWSPAGSLSNATVSNPVASPSTTTTYTVTGTLNGCEATEQVIVSVGAAAVSAGPDQSICAGTSANLSASGATSYNWNPAGTLDNGAIANPVATPASTTTYTVTGTSGTCTATDEVIITIIPLPVITAAPNDSICPGGSLTITANGGTNYSWSPTLGLSDPSIANPSASPASTTTYTVTGTQNGCISTGSVTVTVNPIPSVSAGLDTTICSGGSAQLLASGASSYTWSPVTGLTSSNTAATTASPVSTITYTVTGTALGCAATDQVIVNVIPVLNINAGNDTIICPGASASLNATGATTYSWSPATSLNDPTIQNPVATPAVTTTYTVTGTFGACTGTDIVVVTVPQPLVITPAAYDATCFSACNGQAIAVPAGGTSPYTFSWSTNPPVLTPALANACAGTYTVSVTDYYGCSTDTTVVVNQPTQIIPSNTSTAANCDHPDGAATASANGGNPGYSYTWNTSPQQTSPTAINLTPGTYTYTVTDNNNCFVVDTAVVANVPGVVASINVTTNPPVNASCFGVCDGSATGEGTGGTSPYNYMWSTTPAQMTPTATGLCAGTHTVIVSDQNSCFDTATVVITEPTPVQVMGGTPVTICKGQSSPISASASGGTSGYTYTWWPSTALNDTTISSPTSSSLVTITYSVSASDVNNCPSDTSTVIVTVNPDLTVIASDDVSICENGQTTLSVNSGSGGNGGPYTYTWTPGTGLNTNTGTSVVANPSTTTTYSVVIEDNCTLLADTDVVVITVNPLPIVTFNSPDTTGCYPLSTQLINTTPSSLICAWNFGDGTNSTDCNASHTYSDEGTYNVSLTVTDFNGCVNTYTRPNYINVHGYPNANFSMGPQPTTVLNPNIEFTDLSTGSPTSWEWYFADLDSSVKQNPTYTFPDSGSYPVQLIIMNEYGCPDDTTLIVRIDPDFVIFVPNAFSPNGDNKNETFFPVGYGWNESTFEMFIFDRWGNMIFKTTDMKKGWDGKANSGSGIAQEDTYIWTIRVKPILPEGKPFEGRGTVSIVK